MWWAGRAALNHAGWAGPPSGGARAWRRAGGSGCASRSSSGHGSSASWPARTAAASAAPHETFQQQGALVSVSGRAAQLVPLARDVAAGCCITDHLGDVGQPVGSLPGAPRRRYISEPTGISIRSARPGCAVGAAAPVAVPAGARPRRPASASALAAASFSGAAPAAPASAPAPAGQRALHPGERVRSPSVVARRPGGEHRSGGCGVLQPHVSAGGQLGSPALGPGAAP
jgi:hypothetical protein